MPQPYSALLPAESLISSVVPPTPVTQALVAGQEPDATPLSAARSPSSPELNSTVMPCAAPAMAAWSYAACVARRDRLAVVAPAVGDHVGHVVVNRVDEGDGRARCRNRASPRRRCSRPARCRAPQPCRATAPPTSRRGRRFHLGDDIVDADRNDLREILAADQLRQAVVVRIAVGVGSAASARHRHR